jgi:hypothetical protein
MRNLLGSVALLGGLTITTGALAQDANVGMALPGSAPAPATATAATTDHDQVVGRLAVGYLGRSTVGFGADAASQDYVDTVDAPIIGIRYWLDPSIGIDAGLGFFTTSGSGELDNGSDTTTTDFPSTMGFLVHAGLPIALASADHFTFEIIPEVNVGLGSGSTSIPDVSETTYNGFHLDVGARAGAEIHFGFMKLPQLALQGSIGLLFALDSAKTTVEPEVGDSIETTGSRTTFTTTVGSNPWNIFTSNVAALYYF